MNTTGNPSTPTDDLWVSTAWEYLRRPPHDLLREIGRTFLPFAMAVLALILCTSNLLAQGIPEPSLIFYGTIRNSAVHNFRVTSGTLSWTIRNVDTGRTITRTTVVTNVLGQFSYVLEIPAETSLPLAISTNPGALELTSQPASFARTNVTVDGFVASFTNTALFSASSRNRGSIERLDLFINAPCADANRNGICDWWEDQYFGDFVHPAADFDGDGVSNFNEFLAGTDPTDSASVFHFVSYAYTNGPPASFKVEWDSAEGRIYSLLRTSTLLPGSMTVIRSNIEATPPRNTFLDTNATPPGPYFYVLRLEL